jgi:DNA-directed RNA polymerase subunit RPC12/RpoP
MIKFSCKNCGQKLNADDKHSGKRVKCPKCGCVGVVPAKTDRITFHCESCGQKISVPQIHIGKKGKCPKCQNILIVPTHHTTPSPLTRTNVSIPERTEQNIDHQEAEEQDEPNGVNYRLITMISGVAVVVVLGLIVLAVVLASSGKKPDVPRNLIASDTQVQAPSVQGTLDESSLS